LQNYSVIMDLNLKLTDENFYVRQMVVWALGEIRDPSSINPLIIAFFNIYWNIFENGILGDIPFEILSNVNIEDFFVDYSQECPEIEQYQLEILRILIKFNLPAVDRFVCTRAFAFSDSVLLSLIKTIFSRKSLKTLLILMDFMRISVHIPFIIERIRFIVDALNIKDEFTYIINHVSDFDPLIIQTLISSIPSKMLPLICQLLEETLLQPAHTVLLQAYNAVLTKISCNGIHEFIM